MQERLREILKRYEEVEAQLNDPNTFSNPSELERLGRAKAELEDIVAVIRDYFRTQNDIEESEALLGDAEMHDLAQAQLDAAREHLPTLEDQLKIMLLPKDPNDEKNVIVEVRSAAGAPRSDVAATTRPGGRAGRRRLEPLALPPESPGSTFSSPVAAAAR